MSRHPIPKRALIGCLSGLMAGLVFVAPIQPCQAEETTPPELANPPVQVAESLLNQEPKPRPVMRHREEVPASAVTPVRTSHPNSQALSAGKTSSTKQGKKKKRKAKATAPAASKTKVKAGVKASTKTKGEPSVQTKKATKKTPVKSGKRSAQKDKSR